MTRKPRKNQARSQANSTDQSATDPEPGQSSATPPKLHLGHRFVIGACLLHLLLIGLSALSSVGLPGTLGSVVRLASPYLRATHFGFDDKPVFLTSGDETDTPLILQYSSSPSPGENNWRTIDPHYFPGAMPADRLHRWLTAAATLGRAEQPGLAAQWIRPLLDSDLVAANDPTRIQSIRVVRMPTDLTTDIEPDGTTELQMRVVTDGQSNWFVQIQPDRLSAIATPAGFPSKQLGDPDQ